MRVVVSPTRLEVSTGIPVQLEITVTNPGTIIAGYTLRLLGVDPSWVQLDDERVSLFPDESRTFVATITVPAGLVAGERRMAVQFREETTPFRTAVEEIVLVVPEAPDLQLRVDPVAITAGSRGRFSLLVDNSGNTPLTGYLVADDAEAKLRYRFEPRLLDLAPGEHQVVDLQVRGKRPWMGAPLVRLVSLRLHDGEPPLPPTKDLRLGSRKDVPAAPAGPVEAPPTAPPLGNATFIQKARLTRGTMSLVGLLAALTVFALVITVSLSRIVGQSAQDRDLALKIAAAQQGGDAAAGASSITGKVRLLTTGRPAKAVEVSLFAADDPTKPLTKAVSNETGGYSFRRLAAGDYKLYFQGAGLQKQWFPQALVPDDATTVTVEAGATAKVPDASLGGAPASIAGRVLGSDVADATITLRSLVPPSADDPATSGATSGATDGTSGGGYADVLSAPVGSDGAFSLGNVPSPSSYQIEVAKPGYATSVQQLDVSAGEALTGVELNLVTGNGTISGDVVTNGVPVPLATVTLTSGDTSLAALTGSEGSALGTFSLDHLPTPASYTAVVEAEGFTTQTLTLTLVDGQQLSGVSVSLVKSSGQLSGRTLLADDTGTAPTGGVTVSVSDGERVVQTASTSRDPSRQAAARAAAGTAAGTATTDVGSWSVSGLILPGVYTVTFSRDDLSSQTVSIALDVNGTITEGSLGVVTSNDGIVTVLHSASAEITGLVTQAGTVDGGVYPGLGEVEVTLTSGTTSYSVTTATAKPYAGEYHVGNVIPGTYTISFTRPGVRPQSSIIELVAGQTTAYNPVLDPGARFEGHVLDANGTVLTGRFYVAVYRVSEYPVLVYKEAVADNGYFTFDDVDAPESYLVQVSRSEQSAPLGSRRVTIAPSDDKRNIDVRIRSDG